MAVVTYSSGSVRVQFEVNGTPQEIAGQTKEQIMALEKELAPAHTVVNLPPGTPAPISERHEDLLQWVLSQDAIRSQNYIATHYPNADERATRKALTTLIKAGKVELKPATYTTGKGAVRSMTGVWPVDRNLDRIECEDQGHPVTDVGKGCLCGEYGPLP